jgi:hypothetical protein
MKTTGNQPLSSHILSLPTPEAHGKSHKKQSAARISNGLRGSKSMTNQCKSSVKHAKHSAAKNRASKSIAEVSDFYIFAGKQKSTGL